MKVAQAQGVVQHKQAWFTPPPSIDGSSFHLSRRWAHVLSSVVRIKRPNHLIVSSYKCLAVHFHPQPNKARHSSSRLTSCRRWISQKCSSSKRSNSKTCVLLYMETGKYMYIIYIYIMYVYVCVIAYIVLLASFWQVHQLSLKYIQLCSFQIPKLLSKKCFSKGTRWVDVCGTNAVWRKHVGMRTWCEGCFREYFRKSYKWQNATKHAVNEELTFPKRSCSLSSGLAYTPYGLNHLHS